MWPCRKALVPTPVSSVLCKAYCSCLAPLVIYRERQAQWCSLPIGVIFGTFWWLGCATSVRVALNFYAGCQRDCRHEENERWCQGTCLLPGKHWWLDPLLTAWVLGSAYSLGELRVPMICAPSPASAGPFISHLMLHPNVLVPACVQRPGWAIAVCGSCTVVGPRWCAGVCCVCLW